VAVFALVGGGAFAAAYFYADGKLKALQHHNICGPQNVYCLAERGGSFNVLTIGSDSRVGLTGAVAAQTGAATVVGQRSDVLKIFHVDPAAHTISVLSIPRDTLVTLLANQNLYGQYNRINVNYDQGPGLLVRTVEANFGIPINHVVQVSFAGLIDAVNALGGVWMNFPYPASDAYSGLRITHPGCQLLTGVQALAVARSRHFYYEQGGQWLYDGSSDFGRIDRQNQFLRALFDAARSKYNPATINAFVSALPKGIAMDDHLSLLELVSLAYAFEGFDPGQMTTFTLPTTSQTVNGADVLVVDQPAAQQLLVQLFGQVGTPGGLVTPTNPPPNAELVPAPPPAVTTTSTTTTPPTTPTTASGHPSTTSPVTTTTVPLHTEPWYTFNPVACRP